MTIDIQQTSLQEVCTTEMLSEENSDLFTKGQLDWLLKTRYKNGLAETGAVLKISNKLYINKALFFEWFLKQKV